MWNVRWLVFAGANIALAGCQYSPRSETSRVELQLQGEPALVAPGIASSEFSEIRQTDSPDGKMILWGSTNRPGGPGGWNIWLSRQRDRGWSAPEPASFNSDANDFDPAFSPDGRWVYFFSNRTGGLGGDDIYRAAVVGHGVDATFGEVEHVGPEVNSAGDEWAPALSPDGTTLLFASNGRGGAGRHDLFIARARGRTWSPATPAPSAVNTAHDEFDATFLADGQSIVFARSANLETERIVLHFATRSASGYEQGTPLPLAPRFRDADALGPAMSWHDRSILFFSAAPADATSRRPDLFEVRYQLRHLSAGARTQ